MIKTPYLTVDGIIELYDNSETFQGIVLIERKNPPHGWAIPGGFVDIGERVEEAVVREMKEETSLDVVIESLLGVYSDPKRDPRFHTVSVVYICKAYGVPEAQDDAKAVHIIPQEELTALTLVFDHHTIIQDYLREIKKGK
ncbi:MAG: NUDIX hydrolase [Campylobacterota bacterium]|nr:NUDIX hydrolase [Campylobacterota bacterium]